jgi:hypothetical protein
MVTNTAGTNARIFPWQMKHYIQRGGPNDPVLQASGGPPVTTGGSLGWNSTLTFPPIPGTQTPPNVPLPRVMSLNSAGALTTAGSTGVMTGNTGGILVGTIPGGSWIDNVEIYCYAALSGGTSTSVGLFYAPANTFNTVASPQPATLWALGWITAPAVGTSYTSYFVGAGTNAVTTAGGLRLPLLGYQVGPGNGIAGPQQLCSLGPPEGQGFGGLPQGNAPLLSGDIDLYFVSFLIAGGGTLPNPGSTGEFAFRVDFTGQEG